MRPLLPWLSFSSLMRLLVALSTSYFASLCTSSSDHGRVVYSLKESMRSLVDIDSSIGLVIPMNRVKRTENLFKQEIQDAREIQSRNAQRNQHYFFLITMMQSDHSSNNSRSFHSSNTATNNKMTPDEKVLSDLVTLEEQISLCQSMLNETGSSIDTNEGGCVCLLAIVLLSSSKS